MYNPTPPQKRSGFTLIELLVVVAILALLISILVPSLARARERAKKVVCQTHLHAWGIGFLAYATDFNGGLPMDGGDGDGGAPIGLWSDPWLWFNGVVAYTNGGGKTYNELQLAASPIKANGGDLPKVGNNSLFICPSAGDAAAGSGDIMRDGTFLTNGWFAVTAGGSPFAEQRDMLVCYAMNSQLRQWDMSDPLYDHPDHAQTGDISRLTQLKPASIVPLVAEKRINPNEIPMNDSPNYSKALTQVKITANRFAARHDKGGNIVFADGHVEWLDNKKISHGPGANKVTYYNFPNLVQWHPDN